MIIVPMLGRPHTVAPLLASIRATTPDARVLFMVTTGDHTVIGAIGRARDPEDPVDILTIPYYPIGDYARKINAGYRASTEPHIFLAACDLRFHPGWYEAAVTRLDADLGGIGVVGTNDLGSPRVMRGEHSTHSLVTRTYADRFGTIDRTGEILHEGYVHEYVDDELIGTARHRNLFTMALDAHVEHLHPDWGKADSDELYAAQRSRMARGHRRYLTRRAMWTS